MGLLYLYGLDNCRFLVQFLGAFAKLRKAIITFVTSLAFFLLGDVPTSEFYVPTILNTPSVPSVTHL